MPVFYVARKKVDKSGDTPKERYYATAKALQKRGQGISAKELADELADDSSLTSGDVLSSLEQLPKKIVWHLKMGRTVTIQGLGTFSLALGSDGADSPEECKPSTINSVRICFRPDPKMKKLLTKDIDFERVDWAPEKPRKKKEENK